MYMNFILKIFLTINYVVKSIFHSVYMHFSVCKTWFPTFSNYVIYVGATGDSCNTFGVYPISDRKFYQDGTLKTMIEEVIFR